MLIGEPWSVPADPASQYDAQRCAKRADGSQVVLVSVLEIPGAYHMDR